MRSKSLPSGEAIGTCDDMSKVLREDERFSRAIAHSTKENIAVGSTP